MTNLQLKLTLLIGEQGWALGGGTGNSSLYESHEHWNDSEDTVSSSNNKNATIEACTTFWPGITP